ncbi:MAG: hypothetical protein V7K68_12315 [Nostoc sp.]|uniref:hypothetical protein n=1 Tax=Nostoc sp. TaxID=1180 RepID=UPI002FFCD734
MITKVDLSESVGLFNYSDFGFCQLSCQEKIQESVIRIQKEWNSMVTGRSRQSLVEVLA